MGQVTIPGAAIEVPRTVRRLAGDASLTPVWENERGGLTFRTGDRRFIKYGPRNLETSMRGEAARLRWAASYTPVPTVVEHGEDERHEWLVTTALDGDSAVAPRWVAHPAVAVRAVGEGLRALHDVLPVASCPFEWDVAGRIANAAGRGIRVPDALREPPPNDVLVVCHGDACCPNTLVGADGRWAGHVDFDALGVADRWADIAVASMSTEWNYGPGWADTLIAAYGVAPDRERLGYYRNLWNQT